MNSAWFDGFAMGVVFISCIFAIIGLAYFASVSRKKARDE